MNNSASGAPKAPKKTRKSRMGRSVREVDLDKVHKRLLVVLARDVTHLMDRSYQGKLNDDDAKALTNYLKLMKVLKQQELEDLEGLSDEELAAKARE